MRRSELREHIFRMVFGLDFTKEEEIPEQIQLYFDQLEDVKEEDMEYIRTKAEHIVEKQEEIDDMINTHTKGWKTTRMNKVDLCILRVAVYEMRWDDDVPVGVAIDQAVELAKKYSSDEGPSFINGVLAKLAKA
ncbi:MAG: transcription antitermination factor NusB [Lachnospiraceae bacterium]|nr:transcription antitermination factor NusB [Lachnospiraceae bacterium]